MFMIVHVAQLYIFLRNLFTYLVDFYVSRPVLLLL